MHRNNLIFIIHLLREVTVTFEEDAMASGVRPSLTISQRLTLSRFYTASDRDLSSFGLFVGGRF